MSSNPRPSKSYSRIDADAHVLEPMGMWREYIEPRFRDRTPVLTETDDGRQCVSIDGKIIRADVRNSGALGARRLGAAAYVNGYENGARGGFDPHVHVKDMDLDRIDLAVLYPTVGLYTGTVDDGELAAGLCRAYNRWLRDHCSSHPDRLVGVAMLPMQSVALAVRELDYATAQLGYRAAFIRPNPYNNRMLSDPSYDPLWARAQELDCSIGLHEGVGGMQEVAANRVEHLGWDAKHIASHTMEMMTACLNLVWGGVCERFPTLRFAFLESGGGWAAPWLDRMDRHFDDKFRDVKLKLRPSDYFKRQCWISFEPVEGCLPLMVNYLGANKILWATDYPHKDAFFPGAPDMIESSLKRHNISDEACRQVLAGGAVEYYRF